MPTSRKCVFGCEKHLQLFSLPREELNRRKWCDFIFGSSQKKNQCVLVCDGHFTDDCFTNLHRYRSGFSVKLYLHPGAIPTLKPPDGEARAGTSQESSNHTGDAGYPQEAVPPAIRPVRSMAVQTSAAVFTRTVSTQLSVGTLRSYSLRSKAVEALPSTREASTQTKQHWFDKSSAPRKASTSGFGQRCPKRLRLEDEEDAEDTEIPDDVAPRDSASSTATSIPDMPKSIQIEPASLEDTKYIVFESSLREIFDTCPVCKFPCVVDRKRCGTFVSFNQKCPHCQYSRKWQSGPVLGSTPLGNLQLSASVYFSGGSFVKFARICDTMNLQIQKYCIFRRHSQMYLEPAIYHKWKEDQKHHLEDLKKKGKITVSGDMRADSPGCSIKYGTYTLMDVQSEKVVDMNLVQSNEVGGRSHLMEKEGLCRSLDLLEENGVEVDYIVTDQHPEIQKYLRERDVAHHYDVWHVVKGLSKKLENISKEKECQVVKKWLPAIQNHMYWTASSSTSGPEKVAKWTSLINHIQDVHVHDDPLFPKCVHPEQVSRNPNKWFQPGTPALNKVKKLLVNNRLLEDVAKLSSCYQTSSLESFHSSIVRFTPKKSDFRYVGMLCRQFLAAIHHNENAKWKQALSKDALFKVSYPKYKRAQGATKVKTKTTFGYVAALMHLIFCEIVVDPYKFVAQLKAVAVPDGLCTQFKRASKKDIVADVSRFSPQPGGGGGQNHVRLWSDRDGRSLWSAGGWRCAGAGPTGSRQYGGDSQSCWL